MHQDPTPLSAIEQDALGQILQASSLVQLDDIRRTLLGRKGSLTQVLRGMGNLRGSDCEADKR